MGLEEYKDENSHTRENFINEDFSMAFCLENITGFYIIENFSVGVGFGYQYNTAPYFHTWPIYLDLRGYMHFSDKESLYLFLNGGSLLNLDNRYSDGLILGIGFGARKKIKSRAYIYLGLSAQSKQFNLTAYDEPSPTHSILLRSTSVVFGVGF
jgi:hypothetical protein